MRSIHAALSLALFIFSATSYAQRPPVPVPLPEPQSGCFENQTPRPPGPPLPFNPDFGFQFPEGQGYRFFGPGIETVAIASLCSADGGDTNSVGPFDDFYEYGANQTLLQFSREFHLQAQDEDECSGAHPPCEDWHLSRRAQHEGRASYGLYGTPLELSVSATYSGGGSSSQTQSGPCECLPVIHAVTDSHFELTRSGEGWSGHYLTIPFRLPRSTKLTFQSCFQKTFSGHLNAESQCTGEHDTQGPVNQGGGLGFAVWRGDIPVAGRNGGYEAGSFQYLDTICLDAGDYVLNVSSNVRVDASTDLAHLPFGPTNTVEAFAAEAASMNLKITISNEKIEVIDPAYPNPALFLNGLVGPVSINEDWGILAHFGRQVSGIAADGATRTVIRARVPRAGNVRFALNAGFLSCFMGLDYNKAKLSSVNGTDEGAVVVVPTVQLADGYWAFAELRAGNYFAAAPEDFDARLMREAFNIEATLEGVPEENFLLEKQMYLYRPPLVLIHGLWSSADTWNDSGLVNLDGPDYAVYRADYSGTHDREFAANENVPFFAIDKAIEKLRTKPGGIAVTQADVVGHSMGGILTRLYINRNPFYRRIDNFGKGDVNRLITLNTPHFGSELANDLVSQDGRVPRAPLGPLLQDHGHCVTCGAVRDLRTDSDALRALGPTQIPAHAIVTTGGSDILREWVRGRLDPRDFLPPGVLLDIVTELAGLICGADCVQSWFEQRFGVGGDNQHDFVVRVGSQKGGLNGNQVTLLQFQNGDLGTGPTALMIHTSVTYEPRVARVIWELLNRRPEDTTWFAPAFPSRLNVKR